MIFTKKCMVCEPYSALESRIKNDEEVEIYIYLQYVILILFCFVLFIFQGVCIKVTAMD